jgi:hypothetical protein
MIAIPFAFWLVRGSFSRDLFNSHREVLQLCQLDDDASDGHRHILVWEFLDPVRGSSCFPNMGSTSNLFADIVFNIITATRPTTSQHVYETPSNEAEAVYASQESRLPTNS